MLKSQDTWFPGSAPTLPSGVAVAQEIHDQTCGSSPATAMARATRYFYFCPSAGNLFQSLQEDCFKCRKKYGAGFIAAIWRSRTIPGQDKVKTVYARD